MTEILFYHLERRSLEDVLPGLLARSLERGWRVVVQAASEERVRALDSHLWSYDEASFLPHGTKADGRAEEQPVWLTAEHDNPNGANVRFLVDGAAATGLDGYDRVVFLFDGGDAEAVASARAAWRAVAAGGHDVTYWRQGESGRWVKQG
ncbi:MAG TPA: DNA polymerase III subunit chi [Afifellaceae bacterium]|nr:DNA polymerase III subunit chi [Afifellaceae bacterium]